MSNPFVPILTADLTWHQDLPFSTQYNDSYYSSENGIKQNRHVFIDGNNLINRWSALPNDIPTQFHIGEAGFGTGLNFLLTWQAWEQHAPKSASLHFISCEKHPLKRDDLVRVLSNWPDLKKQAQQLISKYPILTPGYHNLSFDDGRVRLTLMLGDAFECFEQLLICGEATLEANLRVVGIDAWYLDGFSPEKNQCMWSKSLVSVIAMLSKKGSTLSTYTTADTVKSALQDYGFVTKQNKGYGPNQYMITGQFKEIIVPYKLRSRQTPWHINSSPQTYASKSAIVVGAGLAGCFTAHALAKRGWKVTLVDELNGVGKGGSANQQAVLFPKLSAFRSPLTQFMLSAFLYANQVYKDILSQSQLGELNGTLILAYNEKEKKAQQSLDHWLSIYPELGTLVNSSQASILTGYPLETEGLFIPLSGWINSPALCEFLVENKNITLIENTRVDSLIFDEGKWRIDNNSASVLILANGYNVGSFLETQYLPIKAIRGQMTAVLATTTSKKLKIPLCAEGHVLPARDGMHRLGATYELGTTVPQIYLHDDEVNISKLHQLAPNVTWSDAITDSWSGIRASAPDYLPVVGQIAKEDDFLLTFSGLASNSKRWLATAGVYYPGLYACAGFGSRGLTTIPLCAEWLAANINNEINSLPRNLTQSISPARFLHRNLTRGLYSV